MAPPSSTSQSRARAALASPTTAVTRSLASDFLELTKPRITILVTFTALVGFVMASPGGVSLPGLAATLAGTALVASGSMTLNMLMERDVDAFQTKDRQTRPWIYLDR